MRVGYARVSTNEQDIAGQLSRLADCERVFAEKQSGKLRDRKDLAECLAFVRAGDVLVCTRLDRLARSVSHLCEITDTLARKGVDLLVLDQAIDTSTPTGRLLFHMLAAIAEFELSLRKEAQRAGLAHARAMGKQVGRPKTYNTETVRRVSSLRANGLSIRAIAKEQHLGRDTVHRLLEQAGITGPTFSAG